jgi:hypothetical protein
MLELKFWPTCNFYIIRFNFSMNYIGKLWNFIYSSNFKFLFTIIQPINFSYICCDILDLKGDNYKVWKEDIILHLGWMNMDYAN